jgi:hypothetical protein
MPENPKPDAPDAGQPLSAAGQAHAGDSGAIEKDHADPTNPASKPQGTQRDQEKNKESEGQPVQPVDDGDLPASTDDRAERAREAKLVTDGSGF